MSSFLAEYEKENMERYKKDVYTVEIVRYTRTDIRYWYKIGEIYKVRNYRSNPKDYWELADWNGNRNYTDFWIQKKDAVIINDKPKPIFELPDEIFD